MTQAGARWASTCALIALSAAAQLGGLVHLLRYDRAAIAAGEFWRLLTGNLVHLGTPHLLLNAVGLVLVAGLVGAHLRLGAWGFVLVVSSLAVTGGLWLAVPELQWYVGLSGVLHGLIAAGAAFGTASREERWFSVMVLLVLIAKLGWEQAAGAMPGSAEAAGGPVVVDAHLFGALGGLLATAVLAGMRRLATGDRSGPGDRSGTPGP